MKIQDMRSLVQAGRMNRREFVQLAIAGGLTASLANTLFAGALSAAPRKGGTFRIGIGQGSTTDSLDPATWSTAHVGDFGGGVFGAALTEIDPKNAIRSNLAESFEPDKEAVRWAFKLRKGLTFHNGKSLTSADVVETYNYHRAEESKSAVKSVLDSIADVKADGSETVIFTLKGASADFPYVTSDYHLPIFPAKEGGGIDWQKGQGAGPFVLESFEPGLKATAVRNPNYHKPDTPNFNAVELLVLTDVTARTNALATGDIDYMERVDLKTIEHLKQNPKLAITNITGLSHYVAPMNVTVAPFDNVDVRLALKWAIDRHEIVQKVLQGYGFAGNDNPMAPSMKFATAPEPAFSYDPERARFHLKKAGLDSLKVDFSVSEAAFAGALNAGLLMQNSARAANIDINVIREPEDAYWDNVWMKKPWSMSFWSGRPTADWLFTTTYAAEAEWNETFWKHPRFNDLLVAARSETDDLKRQEMYAEMQQILHDDGGEIVLMFNNFVSAHVSTLAHNDLNSNYDHDGRYIYERWWFTA